MTLFSTDSFQHWVNLLTHTLSQQTKPKMRENENRLLIRAATLPRRKIAHPNYPDENNVSVQSKCKLLNQVKNPGEKLAKSLQ